MMLTKISKSGIIYSNQNWEHNLHAEFSSTYICNQRIYIGSTFDVMEVVVGNTSQMAFIRMM